jgi:hypothetical protein
LASDFSDSDFSALDGATDAPEPQEDKTPDTKTCPTCKEEIFRAPGSRGRLPKYHPDCRPSVGERVTGATKRVGRNDKASKEADEAVELVKKAMIKGAMGLAMIDHYDGFVVMTAIPGVCENLHGVLVAHDGLRKDMLALKSGGSIAGLIFSCLMMALPIAAHHGLIPQSRIAEMLTNMPIVLHKISKRMKEGEAALADMMDRAANEMLKPPANPNTPNPKVSPDGLV